MNSLKKKFEMEEGNLKDEYRLVCSTLRGLSMGNYEQAFKENEMTDEAVKVCLNDDKMLSYLKQLIPKVGHQVKFTREFLARSTEEDKSEGDQQELRNLKGTPEQVHNYVAAATKIAVEVTSEPSTVKSPSEDKQDALRMRAWTLARLKAVQVFVMRVYEELADREDYVDGAELKDLLNESKEAARKRLLKSAPEKPSKAELEAQMEVLEDCLEEEVQEVYESNEQKRNGAGGRLETGSATGDNGLMETIQKIMKKRIAKDCYSLSTEMQKETARGTVTTEEASYPDRVIEKSSGSRATSVKWEKALDDAMKVFHDAIREDFDDDDENYMDQEELTDLLKDSRAAATRAFKKVMAEAEQDQDKCRTQMQILQDRLKEESEKVREANKKNRLGMEERLEMEAEKLVHCAMNFLRQEFSEKLLSPEDLQCIGRVEHVEALRSFHDNCAKLKGYNDEILSKKLKPAIDSLIAETVKRNVHLFRECQVTFNKILLKVEKDIKHASNMKDEEDFTRLQRRMEKEIEEATKCAKREEKYKQLFGAVLQKHLVAFLTAIKSKVDREISPELEAMGSIQDSIAEAYAQAMMIEVRAKITFPTDGELADIHSKQKELAMNEFEKRFEKLKSTKGVSDEKMAELRTKFESRIEDSFITFQAIQAARKMAAAELHRKYVDAYRDTMENTCTQSMHFLQFYLREKHLRAQLAAEFSQSIETYLQGKQIETRLHEFNKETTDSKPIWFEKFIRYQETNCSLVERAKLEAFRYYFNEMDSYADSSIYVQAHELKQSHDRAVESSLIASKKVVKLSTKDEHYIQNHLNALFFKFRDDNERKHPRRVPSISIDHKPESITVGVAVAGDVKLIDLSRSSALTYLKLKEDSSNEPTKENQKKDRTLEISIFDLRRLVGKNFNDDDVQLCCKDWKEKIFGKHNQIFVNVLFSPAVRPEQLLTQDFVQAKATSARFHTGQRPEQVMVTVPSTFTVQQKKAIMKVASGLNMKARTLAEPEAAVIAYQLHKTSDLSRNVVVFHLGFTTFNVSVLLAGRGNITITSSNGISNFGGLAFDTATLNDVIGRANEKSKTDLTSDIDSANKFKKDQAKYVLLNLLSVCSQSKEKLSDEDSVTIKIDYSFNSSCALWLELTREDFNKINMPLFKKCISTLDLTLKEANLKANDIQDVILAGGCTRIPKIREMLLNYFDGRKIFRDHLDPESVFAYGAALQASLTNW